MKQRGIANFLIILLGFFLIFVLIGYFKNNKTSYLNLNKLLDPNLGQQDQNFINNQTGYPYIGCGVQIDSPFAFSKIENVFEFSGSVSGCGWEPKNGFIGIVEILDAENNPMTDQISVPINPDGKFKINIAIKRSPISSQNSALLIFKNYNASQIANFNVYLK